MINIDGHCGFRAQALCCPRVLVTLEDSRGPWAISVQPQNFQLQEIPAPGGRDSGIALCHIFTPTCCPRREAQRGEFGCQILSNFA